MEQFLGNVKLTVTGIIVVAVALLLAVASCKGNGKDADGPVDESQLLFYEAYTNAEVGDAHPCLIVILARIPVVNHRHMVLQGIKGAMLD